MSIGGERTSILRRPDTLDCGLGNSPFLRVRPRTSTYGFLSQRQSGGRRSKGQMFLLPSLSFSLPLCFPLSLPQITLRNSHAEATMVTFQCSVVRAPQESVSINSPGQWLLTVAIHSPHPGLTDSEHQRGRVECSECVLHLHGRALTGRRMGTPAPLRPVFPGSKQLAQLSPTKGQRIWGQAATLRPLCSFKQHCRVL